MMVSELTLKITKTTHSRLSQVDFNNIPFGRVFSDHYLVIDFVDGAWQQPEILPYGNMSISPACSGLHYGQLIFEGMKANKDVNTGDVLLFRPEENAKRLNRSAKRMCMPKLSVEQFMDGLKELVKLDRAWIPDAEDSSLYIRPLMFANDHYIGVRAADTYRFVIFTCPVGPYYGKPINVLIADDYVRAAPGGTGTAKAAGNYGGTLYPAKLAREKGFDQILWTDAYEHKYLEEIGTMNVLIVMDGKLVTPELDGTILEGITRESVLQLFRDEGVQVEERKVSVDEILDAHNKGTLEGMYGVGTAAVITKIGEIGYKNLRYALPDEDEASISMKVKRKLDAIKRGKVADKHGWIVRV